VVRKTLKIWLILVGAYGLILLLAVIKPLEFLGVLILPLYLFPLFLDGILRIPYLAHDNPAGWGWGSPTILGWVCGGFFVATVLWLLAWFVGLFQES
jgi:hypothetical protein